MPVEHPLAKPMGLLKIKVPYLNHLNTVLFPRTLKRLGGKWLETPKTWFKNDGDMAWHLLHSGGIASEVDGDKFVCMDRINNKKAQMQK